MASRRSFNSRRPLCRNGSSDWLTQARLFGARRIYCGEGRRDELDCAATITQSQRTKNEKVNLEPAFSNSTRVAREASKKTILAFIFDRSRVAQLLILTFSGSSWLQACCLLLANCLVSGFDCFHKCLQCLLLFFQFCLHHLRPSSCLLDFAALSLPGRNGSLDLKGAGKLFLSHLFLTLSPFPH